MPRYLSQLQSAWWRFWWGKVDPRPLAAVRIAMATAAMVLHLTWWSDVEALLAHDGLSRLVVDLPAGRGLTIFALPFAEAIGAHLLHALTLLPLLGLLLGWKSRWMALLSWLVVLGWYQRVPGASTGGDRLLRYALFYLSLGNCGGAWSVDARSKSSKTIPVLPLRLIQVQWAAMYALGGFDKAAGSRWMDGTALHYALSNLTFARAPELIAPLVSSAMWVPVFKGTTWVVLAWELLFPLLVLHRTSRRVALIIGVVVHLGIGFTMSVGPFTSVTLLGYLAFLDGGGWKGSIRHPRQESCNPPGDSAQDTPDPSGQPPIFSS